MPSRRKKKRSCVKIRLLFWNTSCCLSYLLFLHWYISSDCMSQSVWQLSCRENYKWLYGKERDTNSVIFLFVFSVFNSKSSSSSTMKCFLHTRNFQNSSAIQRPEHKVLAVARSPVPFHELCPALKGWLNVPGKLLRM